MIKLYSLNASLLRRWQNALEQYHPQSVNQPVLSELKAEDILILHRESLTDEQMKMVLDQARSGAVVLLTDTPNLHEGCGLIQSGIRGYSNSYMHETLMPEMVSEINKGNIWAVPELLQSVLHALLSKRTPDLQKYDLSQLSDREREVFDQLIGGSSNKEIARALEITERTVKAHVGNILKKTGAPDRVHLIVHGTS